MAHNFGAFADENLVQRLAREHLPDELDSLMRQSPFMPVLEALPLMASRGVNA